MPTRQPSKLREARTELYRRLVRDAAEGVFARYGFAAARVEQIAKQSGVSIGTIYRVFPGRKLEIYRTIHEQRGTELIAATRSIGLDVWKREGLLAAMLTGLAALVEYFSAHPDYLALVLREEKAWGVGPERTSTAQTVMWRTGVESIVLAMRQGIAEGLFVDEDAEAMARAAAAMQQAHLGYWLENGMRAPASEVTARLQRQFVRAFCRQQVLAAQGVTP